MANRNKTIIQPEFETAQLVTGRQHLENVCQELITNDFDLARTECKLKKRIT